MIILGWHWQNFFTLDGGLQSLFLVISCLYFCFIAHVRFTLLDIQLRPLSLLFLALFLAIFACFPAKLHSISSIRTWWLCLY